MQDFSFHNHTPRCGHAENFLDEDLVRVHIEKGFKHLAFTDHCPRRYFSHYPFHRSPMYFPEKEGYLRSIESLKEKYADQIEIISGYEYEYVPGLEKETKEMRSEVQLMVQGQHMIFGKDYDHFTRLHMPNFVPDDEQTIQYAELLKRGCLEGYTDIIAHPDLYMIHKTTFGKADEKAAHIICQVAEQCDLPMEINLAIFAKNICIKPQRITYPVPEFWSIASTYNVKVLYGIDTHMLKQVECYEQCLEDCLKFLGPDLLGKFRFCSREDVRV